MLMDFEGTMGDELTVRTGDVIKKVTKASEEGWLQGELQGKRGVFPANFVKVSPTVLFSFCVYWLRTWIFLYPCVSLCLICGISLQEVPVYLIGDSKREPRSIRKSTIQIIYSLWNNSASAS